MPAPQASMMKQLARAKFSANMLKVPTNWRQPSGNPAGSHYGRAFTFFEKISIPDLTVPPLFIPASLNKYHTQTQKKLTKQFGAYIDGISDAICSAWSQWQTAATLTGLVVNAVTATGGQIVGPPLTPLILASGPKATAMEAKYTQAIATVIGTSWMTFLSTVKVPGLPWYPAFAAVPSPVAPPTPNTPVPFASLVQVPASIAPATMKKQMEGMLGDPGAPFHKELFDCVCDAFDKCYTTWKASTMVTQVMGTGPVPTFAPPFVPVGPVVGGTANMVPGGFT